MPASSLLNSWAGLLTQDELDDDLVVVATDLGVCLPKGRGVQRLWGPKHWALRHVNFQLRRGESIGVLGRNGSGKSTLLRTLAGIITSDEGSLRFAPNLDCTILAPGAGFDSDLTGRENLFASALFQGHLPEVVRPRVDDILAFSEIGAWADEPVGIYSAGMKARLGFSLSLFLPSDILMIDETLSAGDAVFREKASEAVRSLVGSGRTVIIVSHNVEMIRNMCTRGIVLDAGAQVASADIDELVMTYQKRTLPSGDGRNNKYDATDHTFTHINIDGTIATVARNTQTAVLARRTAYGAWKKGEQAVEDTTVELISAQRELIDHFRLESPVTAEERRQNLENSLEEATAAEAEAKRLCAELKKEYLSERSVEQQLRDQLKKMRTELPGASSAAEKTDNADLEDLENRLSEAVAAEADAKRVLAELQEDYVGEQSKVQQLREQLEELRAQLPSASLATARTDAGDSDDPVEDDKDSSETNPGKDQLSGRDTSSRRSA